MKAEGSGNEKSSSITRLKRYTMVDSTEQEKSGGDGSLMLVFATAVGTGLATMELLPLPEAMLLGYTVSFLIGYWVPPKPTIGYFRWSGERIATIAVFYLLMFKIPPLLALWINVYVAYGIGFLLSIAFIFGWRRHPKSTFRKSVDLTNH